jgi:hypothetical protein
VLREKPPPRSRANRVKRGEENKLTLSAAADGLLDVSCTVVVTLLPEKRTEAEIQERPKDEKLLVVTDGTAAK